MAFQDDPELQFSKDFEAPASPAVRAGAREWLGLALLALPTVLLGLCPSSKHLAQVWRGVNGERASSGVGF